MANSLLNALMINVVPVILSGGGGSRLWPKSRKNYPKQLHKLYGNYTMLQHTVNRVKHWGRLIVVCNDSQRFMVASQLSEVCDIKPDILLEPASRNTAPAIAAAAEFAKQKYGAAKLLVLAADHLIEDCEAFLGAVELAFDAADRGNLAVLGVTPTQPVTNYGYIRAEKLVGPHGSRVIEFVEKPDRNSAEGYLASGKYLWNSGIFLFPIDVLMEELERQQTAWLEFCSKSVKNASIDLDFVRLESTNFEKCESISIDYALLENTDRAWVVPLDAGWNDLGSWETLWDVSKKDESGNAIFGDVVLKDCRNSYIHSENRLTAAVGLEDIVLVDTEDALLIVKKHQAQDVKCIVDSLQAQARSEHVSHRRIYKPWGSMKTLEKREGYQVNYIEVDPGASLSLQMHQHRAEHWVVIKGIAKVERDGQELLIAESESIYIPRCAKHRLSNPGKQLLIVIEVQTGSCLDEHDVIRFG